MNGLNEGHYGFNYNILYDIMVIHIFITNTISKEIKILLDYRVLPKLSHR